MTACPCPTHSGRQITDPDKHAAWHRLVVEQGGPAGLVDTAALQALRGHKTPTPTGPTVLDEKAVLSGRRRSSAAQHAEAREAKTAREARGVEPTTRRARAT